MWVSRMELTNVRSIASAELDFARGINVLIGRNNTGKSSLLLPLMSLQEGLPSLTAHDLRITQQAAGVSFEFEEVAQKFWPNSPPPENVQLKYSQQQGFQLVGHSVNRQGVATDAPIHRMKAREPNNFIYPFFSRRKVTTLADQISDVLTESVPPTFENLNAKIDRLSNPEFLPAHELYMRACNEILGFKVTAAPTPQGKRAVYTVRNMTNIPLLSMGEGVMNILGLVVHLAVAEGNLFLVEEPENDVHPRALKALMDLIIEKSSDNQFIITTHSNIVLKRLGAAANTKVFQLDGRFDGRLPTTTVAVVPPGPEARREILEELGYDLSDDELWSGWLFLEESSAERIIREHLIPSFAPKLQHRLRTFSARSRSEVARKLRDFNDLFVFLHLQPTYKNRAWVVIDGGAEEAKLITVLRDQYSKSGWRPEQFRQFSEHDFEDYYPARFATQVQRVREICGKQEKRSAKIALLDEVVKWIEQDSEAAMAEFEQSAAEVICILQEIETVLTDQAAVGS